MLDGRVEEGIAGKRPVSLSVAKSVPVAGIFGDSNPMAEPDIDEADGLMSCSVAVFCVALKGEPKAGANGGLAMGASVEWAEGGLAVGAAVD